MMIDKVSHSTLSGECHQKQSYAQSALLVYCSSADTLQSCVELCCTILLPAAGTGWGHFRCKTIIAAVLSLGTDGTGSLSFYRHLAPKSG